MLNEDERDFENLVFNPPSEPDSDVIGDDEDVEETDFSDIGGKDFKSSLSVAKKKVKQVKKMRAVKKKKKPLIKQIPVKKRAFIESNKKKKIANIIVPTDRKLIVEGVDQFITSGQMDWFKNIEYYKGERLKQVILLYNNTASAVSTTLDLFDPSSRVDWLLSNTQDVNDVIQVAGGTVRYSDILFNLLANPMMIVNAKFIIEGATIDSQLNEALFIKNKNVEGWQRIAPLAVTMRVDTMQKEKYVVSMNFAEVLNRPFIADGMDVAQYTVLAGNSVTMCFYVKQFDLKRLLFEEAEHSKLLLK